MMATAFTASLLGTVPLPAAPRSLRVSRGSALLASPAPLQPARRARPCSQRSRTVVTATAADAASTVKIIVQGRHMPVTPSMKEYAETKVANAVHNFAGIIREVDVTLTAGGKSGKAKEAHHQRDQAAEVTIYTNRYGVVRAEEVTDDCYAAIDLVCDKLKRKLRKVKERALQKSNWPGRGGPKGGDTVEAHLDEDETDVLPGADALAPSIPPEIVREKVFLLEPMSVDEALQQIDQVGHDFYLFLDASSNEIKVIYRRKAHGYGIIIPALTQ